MDEIRAIDRIRRSHQNATRSIVVPEWENLELFFSQLTIADQEAVESRDPGTVFERQCLMLIHKAKDAEGRALFQMGDMHYLKTEADFGVVQRVVKFMYDAALRRNQPTTLPEATRQVADNPPSASGSSSPSD